MATSDTNVDLDAKLDEIEHIIETLDTAYLLGEPTIHPITNKLVSDPEYDRLYGQNGSERALLKKERPDSDIFKGVNAAKVDFSASNKCVHNPPMTSISKADGDLPVKQKILGEWMLFCLSEMKIPTRWTRSTFALKKGTSEFEGDPKEVHSALTELAETKDAKGNPVFVQSLKHDGCAISLYYKNGKLVLAGNRPRDGINAASVLDHVRYITGIPNSLLEPITCSIRGEVECRISDFEKVNAEAKASGKKAYENPRNATAGAMNPLGEPKVAKERKLSFTAYAIENFDNAKYTTAMERAIWANKTLKVPFIRINPFKYAELKRIEDEVRSELDYCIDGVIIEVNDLSAAEDMGREGDREGGDPRCKIAWKFAAESATATIKSVVWTTKRTGKCTPVAHFDGIRLAGTTVRKCTIHNVGQLIAGKVGVGAKIKVYKAGEIIPYWAETLVPAANVEVPSNCPSCSAKLEKTQNGVDLMCVNDKCPARHVDSLVHYLKTFGVKGISDSTVTSLIEGGLVSKPADFYRLTTDKLEKIGFSDRESLLTCARIWMVDGADQEKDNAKLLARWERAMKAKLSIPLNKFIATLGIIGASKGTGSDLASHFGTLDKIINATESELSSVEDVGPKKAEAVFDWFSAHKGEIQELTQYIEIEKPKTGIFSGKTFCFSGSFSPDKEHWIRAVEDLGAKAVSAPSKKTDVFVFGPGSGNKKQKAEELKSAGHPIQIIEIEDLEKMMGLDKKDDRPF